MCEQTGDVTQEVIVQNKKRELKVIKKNVHFLL